MQLALECTEIVHHLQVKAINQPALAIPQQHVGAAQRAAEQIQLARLGNQYIGNFRVANGHLPNRRTGGQHSRLVDGYFDIGDGAPRKARGHRVGLGGLDRQRQQQPGANRAQRVRPQPVDCVHVLLLSLYQRLPASVGRQTPRGALLSNNPANAVRSPAPPRCHE
ncbi:hypothetical protein D3C85_1185250 [compost metagenome]